MLIEKLRIGNFGKFSNREFDFSKGLNLISGENEAGKSTIHAFIKAMLFGIEIKRGSAAKDDVYTRFLPWDTPGAYAGSMDFEHDGVNYRIARTFLKNAKSCTCTNLDTGKEVYLIDDKITGLIPELNESNYFNTIVLEQQSGKTEKILADNVGNFIANLAMAKTGEVDIPGALERLKKKSKEISAKKAETDEAELARWLDELEEQNSELDDNIAEVQALVNKENENVSRLEEALKNIEEKFNSEQTDNTEQTALPEVVNYAEKQEQVVKQADEQIEELKKATDAAILEIENNHRAQMSQLEEERQKKLFDGKSHYDTCKRNVKTLREETEEKRSNADTIINKLGWEREEKLKEIASLKIERETLDSNIESLTKKKGGYKNSIVVAAIVVVTGGILAFLFSEQSKLGIGAGIVLMLAGLVILLMSVIKSKENESELDKARNGIDDIGKKERTLQEEILMADKKSDEHEAEIRRFGKELEELKDRENNAERIFESERTQAEANYLQGKTNLELDRQQKINEEKINENRRISEINFAKEQELTRLRGAENEAKEAAERTRLIRAHREEQYNTESQAKKNELESCRRLVSANMQRMAELNEKADAVFEKIVSTKNKLREAGEVSAWADKELQAVEMARNTIAGMSELIYESFGKQLNERISSLAAKLTKGKYNSLVVNKDLSIKFMGDLDYQAANGLSAGTMEQLYLALRMSVGELFFENIQVPVILDEPFAYYDEKRMGAALNEMLESGKQILLFTCKKLEQELLDEMNAEYNSIEL